ncbi:MAG: hypothetical protein EBT14_07540 [Betaproteobacteria bacterium]|nr:hypothetical protein [Betaproteobacteria bacterium]
MSIPDIDAFEERAAIAQYDGGLTRQQAEDLAARAQGFVSANHYWQWLADYVVQRKIPKLPTHVRWLLNGAIGRGVSRRFFCEVHRARSKGHQKRDILQNSRCLTKLGWRERSWVLVIWTAPTLTSSELML